EALAFLHAQGLTHGDLSPRNILFTAAGKPKLGDFGTHRAVGETPGEHGTQGFCAPEIVVGAGPGGLEPARDVYSLAASAASATIRTTMRADSGAASGPRAAASART
ncbi:MAG: protein kinase, partial [Burkholderiaceae bacterium]